MFFLDVFINRFPKNDRSVICNMSIVFLRRLCFEKFRQKYRLLMQNKCFYLVSSFKERGLDVINMNYLVYRKTNMK